jgi:predicted phosphate transport protein (TIGR00153 family)
MRFLPREEKFFNYFLGQVHLISEASVLLVEGVRNGMEESARKISELEKKGDELIHEIFHKLNQTFITPLDPEDIHKVASHLDDVLDGIEEVAHKMVAYRVKPAPPPVHEICGIIHACSKSLELAFEALSKEKGLLEHCIEINRLEDNADQVTRQALAELFDNEKDPIRLIKLKEIYELLEITTDYCEDVADALQTVVVKNS